MDDELVQFLRDRYDEEHQLARAAGGAPWEASVPNMVHISASGQREARALRTSGYVASTEREEHQRHIARHSPARVLAAIEGNRGVLRQYEDVCAQVRTPVSAENRAAARIEQGALEDVLRLLALPYADHPAYRERWRPVA